MQVTPPCVLGMQMHSKQLRTKRLSDVYSVGRYLFKIILPWPRVLSLTAGGRKSMQAGYLIISKAMHMQVISYVEMHVCSPGRDSGL